MDQLRAYDILGLEPGCAVEEIKEAYAKLSKQYHPEEEPEKFQEIHEAYVLLARGGRRRGGRGREEEVQDIQEPQVTQEPEENRLNFDYKEIEPEVKANKEASEEMLQFNFEKADSEQEVEQKPQYSFDDAMQKAEKQEQEKAHELVLEAAAELKILVSPKYQNNFKAFKALFEDKKYESIIRKAEFLEKLCDVLEVTKLKKNIYNYIIDFYRLRGRNLSELSQVGLRLYQILDEKAGIKQKTNPGVYGGIAAGLMVAFRALRPVIRESSLLTTIALMIMAVVLFVWIYKKIHENHSSLFAQGVVAVLVMLSQFFVIVVDLYGTAFGTVNAGNGVAALLMMAAGVWFAVVCVLALVKAILNARKK